MFRRANRAWSTQQCKCIGRARTRQHMLMCCCPALRPHRRRQHLPTYAELWLRYHIMEIHRVSFDSQYSHALNGELWSGRLVSHHCQSVLMLCLQ